MQESNKERMYKCNIEDKEKVCEEFTNRLEENVK